MSCGEKCSDPTTVNSLSGIPYFADLSEAALVEVERGIRRRRYDSDEVILMVGETGDPSRSG